MLFKVLALLLLISHYTEAYKNLLQRNDRSAPVDRDCVPQDEVTRWRNNCNWCTCTNTGRGACTLRGCLPNFDTRSLPECIGPAKWRRGDEWCQCEDGIAVCDEPLQNENRGKSQYPSTGCIPGEIFRKDCNNCICSNTGGEVCTRKQCPRGKSLITPVEINCKFINKESTWREGCDWCVCSEGGRALCTFRDDCLPINDPSSLEPECKGEAQWKDGDKWCNCVNGESNCNIKSPEYLGPNDECTDDSSWTESCNICSCENKKKVCTEIACRDESLFPVECSPGSRWRMDCNTCMCTSTSKAMCTLKMCEAQSISTDVFLENPDKLNLSEVLPKGKDCYAPSGSGRWLMDCNWCSCSKTGIGRCTLRGCLSPKEDVSPACEGEIYFRKGSQICECVDGKGVCKEESLLLADRLPKSLVARAEEILQDENSCYAPDGPARWRMQCNWCSCNNRSALARCTRRGCPPGSFDALPDCEGTVAWKRGNEICECVEGKAVCAGSKDSIAKSLVSRAEEVFQDGTTCYAPDGPARWRVECNWCSCGKGTKHARCTLRGCLSGPFDSLPDCEGTVAWKRGNEICECVEGKAVCAGSKDSTPKSLLPRAEEILQDGNTCYAPEGPARWRMECNWCTCRKGSGVERCTRRGCPPGSSDSLPECEGTVAWKRGNEICECVEGKAVCAGPKVSDSIAKSLVSRAEEVFQDGTTCYAPDGPARWRVECNWCSCGKGSKNARCTKRGCLSGSFDALPDCEGMVAWKRGNEICECVEGKAACVQPKDSTSKSLLVRAEEILQDGKTCYAPDGSARWRLDCNWCTCGKGAGHARCTLRGCLSGSFDSLPDCEGTLAWKRGNEICECVEGKAVCVGPKDNIPKSLVTRAEEIFQDGNTCYAPDGPARWRMACNWCSCGKGSGIPRCTLRGCPPGSFNFLSDCEGTLAWKRGNDICECVEGKAVCAGPKVSTLPNDDLNRKELAVNHLTEQDKVCIHSATKNSKWRTGCNWCHCLPSGEAACTLNRCLQGTRKVLSQLPKCNGDAIWKRGDVYCKCVDGNAHCTEKDIISNPTVESALVGVSTVVKVEKDTSTFSGCEFVNGKSVWKDKCNWCRCSRSGAALCTKKTCIRNDETLQEKRIECRDSARWMIDSCNWCSCVDGYGSCTSKRCLADEDAQYSLKDEECTHHKTAVNGKWKANCNWCSCHNGAKICTRKKCIKDVKKPSALILAGEKSNVVTECTQGSSWIENCNTCYCKEGLIECTNNTCNSGNTKYVEILAESMVTTFINHIKSMILKARSSSTDQCVHGSNWRDDCNWCKCIAGIGVCTKKICIADHRKHYEPTCISGAEWMNDCNVCACLDGISFCSNLRCSRDNRITLPLDNSKKCTPGSRWMVECNWCRCGINGNPLCSLSVCTNNYHFERCAEGSQWRKDDCTWCICSSGVPSCSPVQCTINPHDIAEDDHAVEDAPADNNPGYPGTCRDCQRTSDGCNWCTCANNIQICTQMECVDFNQPPSTSEPSLFPQDDPTVIDEQCVEGNTWIDTCNTCICVDGIEVCSGQACLY